ncbi:MAG: hypothetical protein ABR577_01080 [Pyrinomonadaceae bacterium]
MSDYQDDRSIEIKDENALKQIRKETVELSKAFRFLSEIKPQPIHFSDRVHFRKFWPPVFIVALLSLVFIAILFATSETPFSRQKVLSSIVFIGMSVAFIAPAISIVAVVVLKTIVGEQIEGPNYAIRLAGDIKKAKELRSILPNAENLKVLAAHVKRETDKTADMINFLSQVLLIGGVFLGGILLSLGEKDANTQAAITASIGAFLTFTARLLAIQRLSQLREWFSVIEQAQNVTV